MLTSKGQVDTTRLPMMPIRGMVIFPCMLTPFVVGRKSSVRALEEAMATDKKIFLATQHDVSLDEPKSNEICGVGTIVNIVQVLKLPDGNIKILVEGLERAKVVSVGDDEGFFRATVRTASVKVEMCAQLDDLISQVTGLFTQYVERRQYLNYEAMIAMIAAGVEDPDKLADTIGANLRLTLEEQQELLEIFDPVERLTRIAEKLKTIKGNAPEGVRIPFEVRAVFPEGTNEVMPTAVALRRAQDMGLDLILIAPTAIPPLAKVMNYEQWRHENK